MLRQVNQLFRSAWIVLAIITTVCGSASARVVRGKVVDQYREPIPGATVRTGAGSAVIATDIDGVFVADVPTEAVFTVTAVGYADAVVRVAGKESVTIVLKERSEQLDEVVVIGYGRTTKKELTGSVAGVKRDDLNIGSYNNAMGMLQGKVAGLQIVNPNGADPTGQYQILLRGTNTLSAGQGPLVIIDGVVGADIRNINIQEVESIDVLKDGSAAAIYGTRGTNGVVIVTTKRARQGKTQVTYDGQLSVEAVNRRAKPLSASQFRSVVNDYRPELSSYLFGGDTDWFKEITRTPVSHKHNLSLSGGNEASSHYTSLNYEHSEGLQKRNDYEKMAARTNIRQKLLEGWLDLDMNLSIVHRKYHPSSTGAFYQAFTHNPTESVYDPTQAEAGGYSRISAMSYYNPVAMVNERDVTSIDDNFGANIRATVNIKPVAGLKWENFVAYNKESYESEEYFTHYYPSLIGSNGQASIENFKNNDTQFETTLNYARDFGLHSLQALVGYTYQYEWSKSAGMTNGDFDFDDNLTNDIGSGRNLTAGIADMSSYKEDHTYVGFFGRIMYNYDEKYLLSASLRRDGSSRFGSNHKWGWFPAVSAGWRISREKFMSDLAWLNELKLRAGFGVTGNQDFSNYKSLILMTTSGRFWYNGEWINTYQPAGNPNPDLKWEKKSEFNVGIDMAMFDNRLSATIDYYHRSTSDLLYNYTVPTPPYLYDSMFTNVGEVTNEGIELTVTGVPFRTRDFEWTSTFTMAHNSNKLKKFTNEEFSNGSYKVGWSTSGACFTQRLIEGESLGTFYGPVWMGTDTDGTDVLLGQNGDGSVPEEEWQKIGCAYPDVTMGWTNRFRLRNWDFGFALRASIGGDVLNNYAMEYENLSSIGLRNISDKWLDHREFTSTTYKYSSKYVEDATFLKLDNITAGYTFNFNNRYINTLHVSLTAQNVFTITKYSGVDPEVGLTGLEPGMESMSYYPRTTTFTLGVTATF